MEKPFISRKYPEMVELTAGKSYSYCTCGLAKDENPFCDHEHRTTQFKSLKFTVEKDKKAAICMCRNSSNLPYCDGTHTKL